MRSNLAISMSPQLDGLGDEDKFSYYGHFANEEDFARLMKTSRDFYETYLTENLADLETKSEQFKKDQEMLKLHELPIREIMLSHRWFTDLNKTRLNDHAYILSTMQKYAQDQLTALGKCVVSLVDAGGKIIADQPIQFLPTDQETWKSIEPCSLSVSKDATAPLQLNVTFGNGKRFTITSDVAEYIADGVLGMDAIELGREVKP